ncbi:MAG: T9SS type A sorting domain-containing protein [Bacteroidota bacterium]
MKYLISTLSLLALFNSVFTQTAWVKHLSPVLPHSASFPSWNGLASADPYVMLDNDTLKMWFAGSGWTMNSDTVAHVRIGYAWSLDGLSWTEHPANPVVDISTDVSDFDADGVETPTVLKDMTAPANERYKMWYAGRKNPQANILDHQIGYSTSPDGINWTKYPNNPVMKADDQGWDELFLSSPSVIQDGDTFKMWYASVDLSFNGNPSDGGAGIGYATSLDGINWDKHVEAILIPGSQNNWDSASVAEPSVLRYDNTYLMWYSALDSWSMELFSVGYAHSIDGIHWSKATINPVLEVGPSGSWDAFWASHPSVLYHPTNQQFQMWYTGRDLDDTQLGMVNSLDEYQWGIGFASSLSSLGLDSPLPQSEDIVLSPNPTTQQVSISGIEQSDVTILNHLGQVVSHKKDVLAGTRIDLGKLSAGIYSVLLIDQKTHSRITKKLLLLAAP